MSDEELLENFKKHIEFEDNMDDSMFKTYLEFAKGYVLGATGGTKPILVIMVAALLNDFRVSESELSNGLDALTPFFVQEVLINATDEPTEDESNAD